MPAPDANDDAGILFGDQATVDLSAQPPAGKAVSLAGEQVLVRELRWAEGMRLMPVLAPILADVRRLMDPARPESQADEAVQIDAMLSAHPDAWLALACAATGRDAAWVEALSDEDGLTLQTAAWELNAAFFFRRPILAGALAQLLTHSRSPTPSPTSSAPDSAETTETLPSD
jgi:hypothetical protein